MTLRCRVFDSVLKFGVGVSVLRECIREAPIQFLWRARHSRWCRQRPKSCVEFDAETVHRRKRVFALGMLLS